MKVAIANENEMVSGHFGHCESFSIFEIANNSIVKKESVKNPEHKPGFLPGFLHELGVNVIISGGMGGRAIDLFNEKNIEVIIGITGDINSVIQKYLAGELKSTGSVCHEHAHHESCGEHN